MSARTLETTSSGETTTRLGTESLLFELAGEARALAAENRRLSSDIADMSAKLARKRLQMQAVCERVPEVAGNADFEDRMRWMVQLARDPPARAADLFHEVVVARAQVENLRASWEAFPPAELARIESACSGGNARGHNTQ